jgi:hypothetical protein
MLMVKQKMSITEEITKIASADGLADHGNEHRGNCQAPSKSSLQRYKFVNRSTQKNDILETVTPKKNFGLEPGGVLYFLMAIRYIA